MTLKEASENIWKHVRYIPYKGCSPSEYEYGVITSCNDAYVFVRYSDDVRSKATRAEDLEFC